MFTKASQSLLVDSVVDQIEAAIVKGDLKPGDKLPPSDELQEAFGASRGTLREAFRVLRQKGLLTAKSGAGGGVFVKEVTPDPIKEGLALLIRTRRIPLEHLADFREGLEGCAAELAAERAGPDDLAGLEEMLSQLKRLAEAGPFRWEQFHALEAAMHQTLVKMSGNPLYELNVITVHENIGVYFRRFLPKTDQVLTRNLDDWREMIDALKRGDAAAAGRLMRSHIRRFNREMAARWNEDDPSGIEE